MKKFAFAFLALAMTALGTFAQAPFQGTIKYDFKFMGEGIEAFEAMLPTGMELKVYKTDILTEIQGGMAAMAMGRTITQTKKGVSYMIKDSEETIYVMDSKAKADEDPAAASKPTITKEDEVINVAGYECQKYKVVANTPQGESTSYIWVTDKFIMPKSESAGNGMSGMLDIEGVNGTPLKVMSTQMGMTVNLSASEVSTTVPDKKLFKLPKGYAKEPFDAEKMMGGGM